MSQGLKSDERMGDINAERQLDFDGYLMYRRAKAEFELIKKGNGKNDPLGPGEPGGVDLDALSFRLGDGFKHLIIAQEFYFCSVYVCFIFNFNHFSLLVFGFCVS